MIRKIFNKLFYEFTTPSNFISKNLLHNFHALINRINFFKKDKFSNQGILVWDIRSQPITFDIVVFVHRAQIFFFRNDQLFSISQLLS